MTRTFASLRYPNFALWFFGSIVSNVGTWMQRVAQDWVVLTELTDDSGLAVGITTGLQFLPFLLLSPWAGSIADRVNLRWYLLATNAVMGALGLGLGLLATFGDLQLWHVYAFALLLGVVTALNGPARQVFVAELVPDGSLPNAVSLNSVSFNTARLIGPALAGFMLAWFATGTVFIVNGLTFLGTITALVLMTPGRFQAMERAERQPGLVRAGVAYVRSKPEILIIMAIVAVVGTFGMNFQLTSAMMARIEFGHDADSYGLIGSVLAIGSVTGALMAASRRRVRLRLVIASAFGFGITSGLTAIAPTYETYLLASIPLGFTALTLITGANALVQTTTPPAMRGRVMALYMMVFIGTTPLGSPVIGWIGETLGPRWAIGIGSISALIVAAGVAVWWLRRWNLEVTYVRGTRELGVSQPAYRPDGAVVLYRAGMDESTR